MIKRLEWQVLLKKNWNEVKTPFQLEEIENILTWQ